jgi:hypothetical protein
LACPPRRGMAKLSRLHWTETSDRILALTTRPAAWDGTDLRHSETSSHGREFFAQKVAQTGLYNSWRLSHGRCPF